eukprot:4695362-Pleurochrysis_carterae.AAC.1
MSRHLRGKPVCQSRGNDLSNFALRALRRMQNSFRRCVVLTEVSALKPLNVTRHAQQKQRQ